MSEVAGRLEVIVEASLKGFAAKLKRKVEEASKGVEAEVGIDLDEKGLRKQIQARVDAASKGVTAKVGIDLDAKTLRAKVEAAAKAAGTDVKVGVDEKHAATSAKKWRRLFEKMTADSRGEAGSKGITVPLRTKGKLWLEALKERTKAQAAVNAKPVEVPVRIKPPRLRGLIRGGVIVGLLSLIQPAVGAIEQLVGGLAAMAGAIAPATGTLAAVPLVLSSMVTGMAGVKIASQGVGDAFKAQAEASAALARGDKLTTQQQEKLKAAMDNLSPSARKFVKDTVGLRKQWTETRKTIQEPLFKALAAEVKPLANAFLPTIEKGLTGTSETLGRVVTETAKWAKTSEFQKDLGGIMEQNNRTIYAGGHALGGFFKGFVSFQRAAEPFQGRMNQYIRNTGDWFAKTMQANRENGKTAAFLDKAGNRLGKVWRITKNLGGGIAGIFRAGDASGMRLLNTFEDFTGKWSKWVSSDEGQARISKWFDNVEPGFRSFMRLIGDTGKGLLKWAEDPKIARMLDKIRTEMGPAINDLLTSLSGQFGDHAIDFLTELARGINNLEPLIAIMSDFTGAFINLMDGINNVAEGGGKGVQTGLSILGGLLILRKLKGIGSGKGILGGLLGGGRKGLAGPGILGGLLGRGRNSGFGKGVVPVFVTNPGFGGPGGPGGPKGGPGYVGGPGGRPGRPQGPRGPRRGPFGVFPGRGPRRPTTRRPRLPKSATGRGLLAVAAMFGIDLALEHAPKGVRHKANKALGSNVALGAGLGSMVGGLPGAAIGGGLAQGNNNVKLWKDYFGGTKEVGKSQKSIATSLQKSKVGEYAKDLGININKLADDLAANGKSGDYYKKVQKSLKDYSLLRANLEEELPGGKNTNAKKRLANKSLEQIAGGVDANRATGGRRILKNILGPSGMGAAPKFGPPKFDPPKKIVPKIDTKVVNAQAANVRRTLAGIGRDNGFQKVSKDAQKSAGHIRQAGTDTSALGNKARAAAGQVAQIAANARRADAALGKAVRKSVNAAAAAGAGALPKAPKGGVIKVPKIKYPKPPPARTLVPSPGAMQAAAQRSASRIRPAYVKGANGARNATQSAMQGVVNAVRSKGAAAASAAKSKANQIKTSFNGMSGSLRAAGAAAMAGLTAGINANGAAAVAAAVGIANQVAAATRSALQVRSPSRVFKKIGGHVTEGFAQGIKKGRARVVRDQVKHVKKLGEETEKQHDKNHKAHLSKAAKRHKAAVARVKAQRKELVTAATEQGKEYGSVTSIADANGGFLSPSVLIAELTRRAGTSKAYREGLKTLRKRGMGKEMYKQLLAAGAEVGGPLVEQLKSATPAQLKQIKALQAKLSSYATGAAKDAGSSLYKMGKQASDGLVKGVKSRRGALAAAGKAMGKTFASSVKKELRIHSPSRVMERLGGFTVDGMTLGVQRRAGGLRNAARSLSRNLASDLTPSHGATLHAMTRHSASRTNPLDRGAGAAPLVGSLTIKGRSHEETQDALEQTMFALRQIRNGGVYADRTA